MSAALVQTEQVDSAHMQYMTRQRRPRVLHLINSFDIGGTERQAFELLKRLDARRYDVRLAALRLRGPLYDEIAGRFPDVPEFPLTSFYNTNAAKQLGRLRSLMIRERIDLLHAHDFYAGLIGSVAARFASVRVIASQRHLELSDRLVHDWGTHVIHRLAHRILVNSDAIRESILARSKATAHKVVVIKNGVSPRTYDRDHDGLCRELGLPSGSKLVGMVARLQPVKGHRYLLDAAARVFPGIPNSHLLLVGGGPLSGEIQQQAEALGLRGRVHLLGDRLDTSRLVASFDLMVLASLREGLPNAVMEGMAAETPLVATAVGGVKELIEDGLTGYLVPPADSDRLAKAMAQALGDESQSRAIAMRAQRFISSKFPMELMVESVQQLYDEELSIATKRS